MAIRLPGELQDDVDRVVAGVASGRVPAASLDRVWAWLEDEGYGEVMDVAGGTDWIVADTQAIARDWFRDADMRSHRLSPLEFEDQKITNADRLAFMRRFFDELPEEWSERVEYPSVAAVELAGRSGRACFCVFVTGAGQAGADLELKGVFRTRSELKSFLDEEGFVELVPKAEGARMSDEQLLNLWQGPRSL